MRKDKILRSTTFGLIFLSLAIPLFYTSCVISTDEPAIPMSDTEIQVPETRDNEKDPSISDLIKYGEYITEDTTEEFGIYSTKDFYYQKDCHINKDFTTWRIGRWKEESGMVCLNYKDGSQALMLVHEDFLEYFDGEEIKKFFPMGKVTINLEKNPNYYN